MATKPLTWVTPEEFRERTSLTFSRRSPSTQRLDLAYAAYYESQTEFKRKQLYRILQDYLVEHGGYWNMCARNTASGGLLEWMYNEVAPPSVRMTTRRAAELDHAARTMINAHDIPHSRYGVLYLLGNIQIQADVFNLVLEGVSCVGATVGSSLTTNFNDIGNAASSSGMRVGSVGGRAVTGGQAIGAGRGGLALVGGITGKGGSVTAKPPPIGEPRTWFPCTGTAVTAAASAIGDAYEHGRYFVGTGLAVGATLAAPVVIAGALVADAARALYLLAKDLFDKLYSVFDGLATTVTRKLQDRMFVGTALGAVIKGVVKFAVDMVMKNAAPFVGGAIDIGTGLVRTIDAACTRIAAWLDRRKINITPGHPEEIANNIEHSMTIGIFKGLLDILKGAAKSAATLLGPGLGSVVAAAMSAMEWIVKMIARAVENEAIKTFLGKARIEFAAEKARAQLQPSPGHERKADGGTGQAIRGDLAPRIDGTGIISDTARFTAFFKEGCSASPLIPMLTLNSGICGSLMTFVQLFDNEGEMIRNPGAKRQVFDIGHDYFRRLKQYSVEYMQACGFEFSPLDLTNDSIRGILNHATGKIRDITVDPKHPMTMQSHVAAQTRGNQVLAALRA
ncbi:hypothetical protein [Ramlibacter sp.]|uniref:hypothetical protein n=1 Tax=Ramlibacter sp. TaxID=1917967 RepID=UPI003D13E935